MIGFFLALAKVYRLSDDIKDTFIMKQSFISRVLMKSKVKN